jgi:putative glutamine amidotransferase
MEKFKISQPLIGITSNLMTISEGPFEGQGRFFLNQGYVDSVVKAGGIPLILPIVSDPEAIRQQLFRIEGLIFSGGQDVHPSHYDEVPHLLLGEIAPERDSYEYLVLKIAEEMQIPILGICRGLQLMNVYHGGTLHQDLRLAEKDLHPAHTLQFNLDLHDVELAPQASLSQLFNASSLKVNSYHHQTIKEVASGWAVTATSADGLIEGIAKESSCWQHGVQWHPEVQYAEMEPLFAAFIEAARRTHEK